MQIKTDGEIPYWQAHTMAAATTIVKSNAYKITQLYSESLIINILQLIISKAKCVYI